MFALASLVCLVLRKAVEVRLEAVTAGLELGLDFVQLAIAHPSRRIPFATMGSAVRSITFLSLPSHSLNTRAWRTTYACEKHHRTVIAPMLILISWV